MKRPLAFDGIDASLSDRACPRSVYLPSLDFPVPIAGTSPTMMCAQGYAVATPTAAPIRQPGGF